MKMIHVILGLLVMLMASSGYISAQKDDRKHQKDLVEVRLNLTVRNAAGLSLTDIKQEDVKIFENDVEQKITRFSKKEPKINLGLVIDNTGSMRTQLSYVKETAKRVVNGMGDKDEVFLVRFVGANNVSLLQDWSSNKTILEKSLDLLRIESGMSAVIDGLYSAADHMLKRSMNSPERFALVLISDCEDRDSSLRESQLMEKLAGTGIQIFVLALTAELGSDAGFLSKPPRQQAEAFAHRMALNTGGAVYFPDDKKTDGALQALSLELNSPYVIGYTSTGNKRGNKPRKLRVEIAPGEKGAVRIGFIREKFVVPEDKK